MPRRPLVIAIFAIVAVLVVVPFVLLVLAGSPRGNGTSVAASDEPAESAEPRAALRPDDIAWTYFTLPIEGGPDGAYALQAGRLGGPGPILDFDVPWVADPMADPGREPALGQAGDGTVVYVEDDGERSVIRSVELALNGAGEAVAELDQVVWSLVVTSDGTAAYAALVDRLDHERELGVVRIALDGSGRIDEVLGASAVEIGGVRLAAWVGLDIDLYLSDDDRHLARHACSGGVGCVTDVLDIASGDVVSIGDRGVYGLTGGYLLASNCLAARGCASEVIDLATGGIAELPLVDMAEQRLVMIGGRPVVAFIELDPEGMGVLRGVDPAGGRPFDLIRPPRPEPMSMIANVGALRMRVPPTHLLIGIGTEEVGAMLAFRTFALPLDGGEPFELPDPAFVPRGPLGIGN